MQQYLTSLLGDNKFVQVSVIVAIALLVILLVYLAFRVLFNGRVHSASARNRQPRLAVVDAFDLDRQRQLVLVRRDHVEHLVMIGGPNDVVIETGIIRAQLPTREKERAEKDTAFGQQSLPFPPEMKPQVLPQVANAPELEAPPMPVHAPSRPTPVAPVPAAAVTPPPVAPAPIPAAYEAPRALEPQAPTPILHRAAAHKGAAPKVEHHNEHGPARAEPPATAEKIAPSEDMIEQLKALVPKEPVLKERVQREPVDLPNPLAPSPRPAPPVAAPRPLPPMPMRTPGLAPRPPFSLRPLTTPKTLEPPKPLEPAKPLGLEPPKSTIPESATPEEPAAPKPENAPENTPPASGATPSPHPLDELEEQMARLLGRPVKLE